MSGDAPRMFKARIVEEVLFSDTYIKTDPETFARELSEHAGDGIGREHPDMHFMGAWVELTELTVDGEPVVIERE